jgi:hypothetical protein
VQEECIVSNGEVGMFSFVDWRRFWRVLIIGFLLFFTFLFY